MPSVDVAIPNRNYAHHLEGCVRSVLRQGGVDVRVLVIDNASSDGSGAVARALAAEDRRVELCLRPDNLGPHASFNAAIDWARADYFLILCSDDVLAPGALARAAAIMDRYHDVHLTYGRAVFLAEGDPMPVLSPPGGQMRWQLQDGAAFVKMLCRSGRNPVSGPTAIVRTAVQKRVGDYRSHLTHTDDLEMWLRFGCQGRVAHIDAVQAVARVHACSQSATVSDIASWNRHFEAAFDSFFAREGSVLPEAARLREAARRSLGERAYWSSIAHRLRGEPGASELMGFALRVLPSAALRPPLGYLVRRFAGRLMDASGAV
jgi:glycosyltransferase involved in cell wall biosynthesis